MKCLIAGLFLFVSACSRQTDGFVSYSPPDRRFSCDIPGDWRTLEHNGGALVSFFNQRSRQNPYSTSIAAYFYASSNYSSPQAYYQRLSLSAQASSPLTQKQMSGKSVYSFTVHSQEPKLHSTETEEITEEIYLVPAQGGFYSLVYFCSENSCQGNEAVFLRLVESFKAS